MKGLYKIVAKHPIMTTKRTGTRARFTYFKNIRADCDDRNFNIFNKTYNNVFKYRKDMGDSVSSLYTMVKYLCTHSDIENTNAIKGIDIYNSIIGLESSCHDLLQMAIEHNRCVMIKMILRGGYGFARDLVMHSLHHALSDDMKRLRGTIISRKTQICVLRQFLERTPTLKQIYPNISFTKQFFMDMCSFGTVDIVISYIPRNVDIKISWLYAGMASAIQYKRKHVATYLYLLLQNHLETTFKTKIENL